MGNNISISSDKAGGPSFLKDQNKGKAKRPEDKKIAQVSSSVISTQDAGFARYLAREYIGLQSATQKLQKSLKKGVGKITDVEKKILDNTKKLLNFDVQGEKTASLIYRSTKKKLTRAESLGGRFVELRKKKGEKEELLKLQMQGEAADFKVFYKRVCELDRFFIPPARMPRQKKSGG